MQYLPFAVLLISLSRCQADCDQRIEIEKGDVVATLTCTPSRKNISNFRTLTWYRQTWNETLVGLFRIKNLDVAQPVVTEYQNRDPNCQVVNKTNLQITNLNLNYSVKYECLLSAPLGQQNERRVICLTAEPKRKGQLGQNERLFIIVLAIFTTLSATVYCTTLTVKNRNAEENRPILNNDDSGIFEH